MLTDSGAQPHLCCSSWGPARDRAKEAPWPLGCLPCSQGAGRGILGIKIMEKREGSIRAAFSAELKRNAKLFETCPWVLNSHPSFILSVINFRAASSQWTLERMASLLKGSFKNGKSHLNFGFRHSFLVKSRKFIFPSHEYRQRHRQREAPPNTCYR